MVPSDRRELQKSFDNETWEKVGVFYNFMDAYTRMCELIQKDHEEGRSFYYRIRPTR